MVVFRGESKNDDKGVLALRDPIREFLHAFFQLITLVAYKLCFVQISWNFLSLEKAIFRKIPLKVIEKN
jgi:hypothetical protein